MEKKVMETRTNRVWLREDGIVHAVCKPQAVITLDDAKENIDAAAKVTVEKKSPLFIDLRPIKSVTREARTIYSSNESKATTTAFGFLIDSPVSRVIGNLFIGINKPDLPTKIFTSENNAIEWLKGFIEKDDAEDAQ